MHIGCATAASLFIMPRVMEQLLASAMKITVHVHEGETGYLLQRLCERSLDLVICRSQFAAPELQNQEVMNEPLRVALPPQHPLCGQAQTPLGALRAERFFAAQRAAGHRHFGHAAACLPRGRVHAGSGRLGGRPCPCC